MGVRSLFTPALVIGGVLFALEALRFVVRILSLSKNVESLLTASRTRTRRLSSKLHFENPAVVAQAVATIGLLALVAVVWRFRDFLWAIETSVSSNRNLASLVAPLRPHHLEDAGLYRVALDDRDDISQHSILRIRRIRARRPCVRAVARSRWWSRYSLSPFWRSNCRIDSRGGITSSVSVLTGRAVTRSGKQTSSCWRFVQTLVRLAIASRSDRPNIRRSGSSRVFTRPRKKREQ